MDLFKRTKQTLHSKKMFGFDIETCNDNKTFVCASVVGLTRRYKNPYVFFTKSKTELINEFKTNKCFRNSEVYATNVGFDFLGTFFDTDDIGNFKRIERGSNLLECKTYIVKNQFVLSDKFAGTGKSNNRRPSILFRDSLNYARFSVEKMGKFLAKIYPDEELQKLPTPSFIKDIDHWVAPSNDEEWEEMKAYNIRDSEITYRFMKWWIPNIEKLGGTHKITIASSALSVFKNKYLGETQILGTPIEILDDLFKAYYGGRTECFTRGKVENLHYYDFNSLYPSVMRDCDFPNPNARARTSTKDDVRFFNNCDGVTEVTVEVPKMKYGCLPYRYEGKLDFPIGTFRGFYPNVELRYAVSIGCKILKVHKSIYYFKQANFKPFEKFVTDLYSLRLKYQTQKNPMEQPVKILMNSLYGKFAEKYDNRTDPIHKDQVTQKQLESGLIKNQIGDWYYLTEEQEPRTHCIPIWALYVTAYGRIKMHKAMVGCKSPVIYCDTDSIITSEKLPVSTELGKLKIEKEIKVGYFIRPKSYMLIDYDDVADITFKGLPKKLLNKESFLNLEFEPLVNYTRVAKLRESIRRDFIPNQTIPAHKNLGMEDGKRDWKGQTFTFANSQESDPLEIMDGVVRRRQEPHRVANLKAKRKPIISKGVNNIGDVAPTMK